MNGYFVMQHYVDDSVMPLMSGKEGIAIFRTARDAVAFAEINKSSRRVEFEVFKLGEGRCYFEGYGQ